MGYFAIYEPYFYNAGVIFIAIESILLMVVYYSYLTKKKTSIMQLSEVEDHCQEQECEPH
jgi:hypothetical protein